MIPVNGAPAATPEAEEFAAGIEVPVAPAPVIETPAVDPVVAWARENFEGIAEDATADTFAEHLEALQERASKAEELERRWAEHEARQAMQATAPQQPVPQAAIPQQPVPAVETPAERKRRFEAIAMDAQLKPFLATEYAERDENGYYRPKVMVPQVIQACDQKNRAIQRDQEIAMTITGDFYGAVDEGVYHSPAYQKLAKDFQELKEAFEKNLTPLQQAIQQTEQERFVYQNQNLLYTVDANNNATPTAAGELYTTLTSNGMDRDKALEIAKNMATKFVPPTPAAPVVAAPAAAAPAAPAPKKPVERFTDPIRRRANNSSLAAPAERRAAAAQEVISNNFRPSWDEIKEAVQMAE